VGGEERWHFRHFRLLMEFGVSEMEENGGIRGRGKVRFELDVDVMRWSEES
jgi:hypothetical protein